MAQISNKAIKQYSDTAANNALMAQARLNAQALELNIKMANLQLARSVIDKLR